MYTPLAPRSTGRPCPSVPSSPLRSWFTTAVSSTRVGPTHSSIQLRMQCTLHVLFRTDERIPQHDNTNESHNKHFREFLESQPTAAPTRILRSSQQQW